MSRFFRIAVLGLACATPVRAADLPGCAAAGAQAEREAQLPAGLLLAIGRIESGRPDPVSGQVSAWPWTINAAGSGHYFNSKEDAAAATRMAQAQGITSIDIGCFQINLQSHPKAFTTLEEGLDPVANARYAAHFLTQLHDRLGSWEAAVAAYHSATPSRGQPYRDQVLAAWGQKIMPMPPMVLQTVTWSPAPGTVRIWTPGDGTGPSVIHFAGAPALPTVHAPRS